MPKVGGRHFAYTPEGRAAAERYKQSIGMHTGGLMYPYHYHPHGEPGADAQTQAEGLKNTGVDYESFSDPDLQRRYNQNLWIQEKTRGFPFPAALAINYLAGKGLDPIEKVMADRTAKFNQIRTGPNPADVRYLSGQSEIPDQQFDLGSRQGRVDEAAAAAAAAEQQAGPYHPDTADYSGMNMFRDGGMMGFRPLGYADGDLVEEYVYPDKESRQSAIDFIATMTQAGDATIGALLGLSDSEIRRAYLKVMADTEAGKYDHVVLPDDIRLPLPQQTSPQMEPPRRLQQTGPYSLDERVLFEPAINPRERVLSDAYETGTFADFQKRQPTIGVSPEGWKALQGGRTITQEDPELLGPPAYEMKNGGIMALRRY